MRVQYLGWEDPLEQEMSTHSSILAWKIPWTEEAGGLVHGIATMEQLIVTACMLQSVWSNEKREFSHSLVVCVALEAELTIGTAGKSDTFCGLLANFYSFKAKKIPVGRLKLGD